MDFVMHASLMLKLLLQCFDLEFELLLRSDVQTHLRFQLLALLFKLLALVLCRGDF